MPVPETPLHKGRHRFREALSSGTCPGGLALPVSGIRTLRRLAQRNYIGGFLHEASALNLQAVFDSREHASYLTDCWQVARLSGS